MVGFSPPFHHQTPHPFHQSPTASVHYPPAPPQTTARHKPTTEHRALARVQTRGCHAIAQYQLGRRHDGLYYGPWIPQLMTIHGDDGGRP